VRNTKRLLFVSTLYFPYSRIGINFISLWITLSDLLAAMDTVDAEPDVKQHWKLAPTQSNA